MAERKVGYPRQRLNRLRRPLLTAQAYMPNFQPDNSDPHIDMSALDLQVRNSIPNPFLRPDQAWRRPGHKLGDVVPIGAYSEDSGKNTKVVAVDAPALKEGNVRVAATNIYVDPLKDFDALYPQHLQFYRNLFEARKDIIVPVLNSHDLMISLESRPRRTGAILTLEGIYRTARVNQPEQLVIDLSTNGIISIMPVHNDDNELGTGGPTNERHGLTILGKRFAREALRRGRIIDLSHSSNQTGWDIKDAYDEVAKEDSNYPPPIISHTGSRERVNRTRNTPDAIAIAVARRGGIIGVMPAQWIVETDDNLKNASVKSVVDLIEYYLDLFSNAGIKDPDKRIAIGSDFDGMGTESIIPGLENIQKVGPALYREMLKRKLPHEIIGNILSQNMIDYYSKWLPKE